MFKIFTTKIYKIKHICRVCLLIPCMLFFGLSNSVMAQTAPTPSGVVDDTCYVTHEGDSLLVVVSTLQHSDGVQISYSVSLAECQFRSGEEIVPRFPLEEGLTMLHKRDRQIERYTNLHGEHIVQYADSIIRHLLPVGVEARLRELYPYEFRDLSLDVDEDGYILAAELYIRTPIQFILFGSVQGCNAILKAFIGKRLPVQEFPTIGNGFIWSHGIFRLKED